MLRSRLIVLTLATLFLASMDARGQWVRTNLTAYIYGLDTDLEGKYLYAHTYVNGGILRSSDLGQSWKSLSVGSADLVFFDSGKIIAGTANGKFFGSMDYGLHWDSISNAMSRTGITALCKAGGNLIAGTEVSGFFLSPDTGRSWIPVNTGLKIYDSNTVWSVSALIAGEGFVIAGTTYPFGGGPGIFSSPADTFDWSNTGLGGLNVQAFASIGPIIFAATYDYESGNGDGVYRSVDSGKSWQDAAIQAPYQGVTSLTYSFPYLIAGTHDYGVFFSTDSGNSWLPSPGVPAHEFVEVNGVTVERGFAFAGVADLDSGLWVRPLSDFAAVNNLPISYSENLIIFPNPFASSSIISFSLPEHSYISLKLYDELGILRSSFFDGEMDAGQHNIPFADPNLPNGIYEVVLSSAINRSFARLVIAR